MSASTEPAIRAAGLSKVYRSGDADLVVFAGLNLEVAQGEKLALVGESGSGKSTLLHLLGGLDRPTEGAIYFGRMTFASYRPMNLRISATGSWALYGKFTPCWPNSRRSRT